MSMTLCQNCGYAGDALTAQRDRIDAERIALAERAARYADALTAINEIRNSIIGMQTMNWSEHIYPLVAALNEAGLAGQDYPEARANVGTLIERAARAEQELADMRDQAWCIASESLRTLEAAEMASKLANPEGQAALFAHWDAGDLCRKFLAAHDARAAAEGQEAQRGQEGSDAR